MNTRTQLRQPAANHGTQESGLALVIRVIREIRGFFVLSKEFQPRMTRMTRIKITGAAWRHQAGFNMVEIAICLGIIGIALVAIIGLMPTGMRASQDNREETIIDQDGQYLLHALCLGAPGDPQLADAVVSINGQAGPFSPVQVIGLLSTPGTNVAIVRSLSGPVADKGANPAVQAVAFKYQLTTIVLPFEAAAPQVGNYLHELRLKLEWPMRSDGLPANRPGTGSPKIFRTLVSGMMLVDTNVTPNLFFFRP
jgi:hypothetical protein